MSGTIQRVARVAKLLDAAAALADPKSPLGQRAREELPADTGLSRQNVELCLSQYLETTADSAQLEALVSGVPTCRKAHVLLSANVFTAPVRAICLALAQSDRVDVRPSRRQSLFTQLLWEASRGAFRIVPELGPAPDDHVWAYGRDENLEKVRGEMPAGVLFHGHASGFGIVALTDQAGDDASAQAAAIIRDVVPFDQRGCLSPRIVLVRAASEWTLAFCKHLARELASMNHDVPLGVLSQDESAELTRYRDILTYTGTILPAGKSVIGLDDQGHVLLAPVGRTLHVARVQDFAAAILPMKPHVTCIGAPRQLHAELRSLVPGARVTDLGKQQHPELDGPVDRRPASLGEVL